ncbi:phage resistance protein [Parafrankia sp. BMG5.11]|uniref:phage resistance protein n=1 Tax=Parafrankia sp. BMG5.11 TaxID=222540 RepID=UPI00103FA1D1|nr:phage resistance protein [Parafrankia sp. BMG5.11]TCJ33271.1 phage resistance protein [Parafrankia sp. BMG5.11]
MTSPSSQPLLRDVIDIPQRSSDSDFVLKLTEGVADAAATMRDYVLTDRLVHNFDEALGLIAQAVGTGASKGVYLHGSFGSGKSHFMAVLHALLRGEPAARALDDLAAVLGKHDGDLAGKKFLLVPFHMLGAKSIEQRVLGGYADRLRALHPEAPIPAVHRVEALLDEARGLRAKVGDAAFLTELNRAGSGGGQEAEEDEWGDDASWTAAELDAALAPTGADAAARRRLTSDLLSTWFPNTYRDLREDAEGFISLDQGLSEIARHAKDLGYDAVVLFLDELILWLANNMGDQAFVSREVQKVTNFVEGGLGARAIPVVSFIARQRDLRELVGESIAGDVRLSFLDVLTLADGRFDKIVLEDRNLPLIANRRLLRAKDTAAAARIEKAFETTAKVRAEVWDTMLGGGAQLGADRDAFRLSYPFSPAFMDTLVHVSSALQRNRTALKLMRQLLVAQRDELRLGQVIPLGDLWDVITRGGDAPFTDVLKVEFEAAQRLYNRKLRPYLLDAEGLDEDVLARVRRGQATGAAVDGELAVKVRRFTADDRLVKTLLLSALAPSVPALRNLTPRRLSALNHGSITSPIPGGEAGVVGKKVERWAGQFGEVKFLPVEGGDPGVGLELVDVEIDGILSQTIAYDGGGNRRALVRRLLGEELGVTVTDDAYGDRLDLVWRGSRRSAEVVFGSLRGSELRDDQLEPADPESWRLVIDYPFDDAGRPPVDARARVERLRGGGTPHRTVCWIPADLTAARLADLGMLVRLDHLLNRNRFDSHAQHLSADDRQRARGVLKSRYDALLTKTRTLLRMAYGLAKREEQDVTDYSDWLRALWPGLTPTLAFGATFREAARRLAGDLLADQFPGHPDLDPDQTGQPARPADFKLVLSYVAKAAEADGNSVEVIRSDRLPMRRIAPALGLGTMHEARFELGREWVDHFTRKAAQAAAGGSGSTGGSGGADGELRVADLLTWIDEPKPRGLDSPVAALIVNAFAEQTDRAWYRYGGILPAPPELTAGIKDMTLREQPLPAPEDWTAACQRAQVLFGVQPPPLRRGRLIRTFAEELTKKAREHFTATRDLVTALEAHASDLGLDPRTGCALEPAGATTGRLRTARAAHDLVTALDGPKAGTEIVVRLAHADLAGPAERLALSISRAAAVAGAVTSAPWGEMFGMIATLQEPYRTEAQEILGRVRKAGAADELTTPLAGVLSNARADATQLMRRAVSAPHVEPRRSDPTPQPEVKSQTGKPSEVIGGNGTADPGQGTSPPAQRQWRVRPAELDRAFAAVREYVGDQPGEIEIIWRPAR